MSTKEDTLGIFCHGLPPFPKMFPATVSWVEVLRCSRESVYEAPLFLLDGTL